VTGRRQRSKQLLDDLEKTRGSWILKEAALDGTLWRTPFGRGYGRVVRENTERIYALHRAGSTPRRRRRSRGATKLGGKVRKQE